MCGCTSVCLFIYSLQKWLSVSIGIRWLLALFSYKGDMKTLAMNSGSLQSAWEEMREVGVVPIRKVMLSLEPGSWERRAWFEFQKPSFGKIKGWNLRGEATQNRLERGLICLCAEEDKALPAGHRARTRGSQHGWLQDKDSRVPVWLVIGQRPEGPSLNLGV